MRSRICPRCGRPYKGARCPTCAPSTSSGGGARTREQEQARKAQNPWRSQYGSSEYQKARQVVLERQNGLCAVSGVRIADKRDGRWVMRSNGGVHHIVPLSEGGSNDPPNLVALDVKAHNRIDSERRKHDRGHS